jgi:hypothetical protein
MTWKDETDNQIQRQNGYGRFDVSQTPELELKSLLSPDDEELEQGYQKPASLVVR